MENNQKILKPGTGHNTYSSQSVKETKPITTSDKTLNNGNMNNKVDF